MPVTSARTISASHETPRFAVWACALALCAFAWASPVDADEPADAGDRAPQLLTLPAITWPSEVPLPDSSALEAMLVIGRDGLAQLDACDHEPAVCDAVRAALFEAHFLPARRNGQNVPAKVNVRFVVGPREANPQAQQAADDNNASAVITDDNQSVPEVAEFGAVARVTTQPKTAHQLELEVMREVPGAFGDPFRVIDTLPGVVPVITGLPYVYVRGAPPSSTVYYFDDIPLPALFHLALGPAVVHPAMVGGIDFYPGVAPARYGRKTGGVVAGQAAYRPLQPGIHGELELRLIDLQAYVATPLSSGGRVEVGGRYGYPGLLTTLLDPTIVFQYWDYQARTTLPLSKRTDLQLISLGSFDLVGERKDGEFRRAIELQFHRLEARVITRRRGYTIGNALLLGLERSGFDNELDITATRVAPRVWLDLRPKSTRLRLGADMTATVGKIDNPLDDDNDDDDGDSRQSGSGAIDNPIYRSATGRNVLGLYGEWVVPLSARWELDAGLRGDLWITGSDAQGAVEPRLVVSHQTTESLRLHAAAGLAYQPAVFLVPIPGLADVALDRGLQRAIQTELGGRWEISEPWSSELKGFAHFYDNILSLEALDGEDLDCPDEEGNLSRVMRPDGCESSSGLARMSAQSLGSELLIRRSSRERVSGWLAYTLSKAWGETDGGRALRPSFDVRHVANLVLQWRISPKWHVAMRGYAQSGRFPFDASTEENPRARRRLPPFARGDLQLARLWRPSWGELRFTFEWLNFTFQKEPMAWNCDSAPDGGACEVEYVDFPITIPMLGVRGSY